ncbi:8-oxo-dGTP diphosphatase [Streptacidiphilus sp. MAP12-16]|uniref:NUDIX hydrolase n=1 Tax=Streptacidiphilus sp. MAP12-16 TaxID=3156300 RepID=UPI00351777E1
MAQNVGHGVGVHLILVKEDHILLGQRANTGFADGWWHVPGGRLERGESLPAGAIREAREELAIEIAPESLSFVHLNHHLDADGVARVGVFFTAFLWSGEPVNAEPEKCSKLSWFRVDDLPVDTVDYAVTALRYCQQATVFGTHGW